MPFSCKNIKNMNKYKGEFYMKRITYLVLPSITLLAFIIWTILVKTVDVNYISGVGTLGFYSLNTSINEVIQAGKTDTFDLISSLLMYGSFLTVLAFAIFGLVQLIKRKSLLKVDLVLYVILAFYVLIVALYAIFEIMRINYSPSSTAEELKVSYPSSHVFISCSLYGVGLMGLLYYLRLGTRRIKYGFVALTIILSIASIITRMYSGAHYFSDIIGGVLLSLFVIVSFVSALYFLESRKELKN